MNLIKGVVPCYACRPGRDWADFHRVLATGDVGLTIYRHKESANKRRTDTSRVSARETIIFYTTRAAKAEQHREMNLEIFSADLPKCVNYCARCKEMMRRIEDQFRNKPWSARGTDLCELFSCPPCTDIVNKLREFAAESAIKKHDSELIHLHRLATPNFDDDVKSRSVLDDPTKAEIMKSAGMSVILKDTDDRNKDEEKERGRDTSVRGLGRKIKGKEVRAERTTKSLKESKEKTNELKTAASKIKKDHARKDRKVVSSTDKTGKDKVTAIGAEGDGFSSKVVKERKQKVANKSKQGKEDKNGMRNSMKETSHSASKKDLLSKQKSDCHKQGDESNKNRKIDEHMRSHERERELDKKRKDIDDKMRQVNLAEEKARRGSADSELARQLKFKEAIQQSAIPEQESVSLNTLECPQDAEVHGFIKGTKLYMAHKPEPVKREKAAEPSTVIHRSKSPRSAPPRPQKAEKTSTQSSVPSKRDGVIRYKLSERRFVRKGWTQLPKEMVMRKVAVFLMRPARQKFDWLEMNKPKGRVLYHSGEELATFDENGTRLYYKNGGLALEYYQAEETNAGDRVVVYSSGKPQNGRARPRTVLAVFDYSGNGAVYDHAGNIRLKYSQTEGVVLDKNIGPHTHWKWHNLDDSPLLQTVQLETQLQHKDPEILKYEDDIETPNKDTSDTTGEEIVMRRIETQNIIKFINEKTRLAKTYSPLQIKMKAFKINECFSLRIFEQNSIYLSFSDGKTRLKINVGLVLDPSVVVAVDSTEVGEVANSLERRPASSASVERLQRAVRAARGAERARALRERRLNGTPSYLMERRRQFAFGRGAHERPLSVQGRRQ